MPTIKKISLNGVTYDLGGGLTEDVKQASLQIAEKVAYIDEHGQDYYDELYTAFYDNMWNVTNTLSNAVNSNSATKTLKDGTYTAIISAATGYTLEGATVSVTMNGANITSSVYNNGVVNIPAVTGDVVITVVAVALTVVSISAVYTQSGTVYDTDSLDSLKDDLVVTATFNDDSTSVVPGADYTLTGTLDVGTDTITVEFGGQTTTFSVTVELYLDYVVQNATGTGENQTFTINDVNFNNGDYIECKLHYTVNPNANDSAFRIGNNASGTGLWTYRNGYKYLLYINGTLNAIKATITFIASANAGENASGTYDAIDNGFVIKIDKDGIWVNGVLEESTNARYKSLKTWMLSQTTLYAGIHASTTANIDYIAIRRGG